MFFGFYGGLTVSAISIAMIAIGMRICKNDVHDPNTTAAPSFVCIKGNEWAPTDAFGNIYLAIVSLMVLMQINLSQYILIRLPYNNGVFDTKQKLSIKMKLLA